MNFFDLLKHRKSVRRFADEPVTQQDLSDILLAANGAPIGSRMYKDIHLTVVRNRDVLDRLSEAAAKRWENKSKMKEILGDYKPDGRQAKQGYDPFYGAPAVIFVSHRNQTVQPGIEFANAACVVYSMHLAAAELGLGSVFMWFALESMRELPELDHSSLLNLPDGFTPLMGIAVGRPAKQPDARELKPDQISVDYIG
ncbi:MAG: nitroreductase family protein [Peptococcaceae bacterium]|jgi:nitroreductase|nr:nitroreductase family protein [Peptococcaceae bacterium]